MRPIASSDSAKLKKDLMILRDHVMCILEKIDRLNLQVEEHQDAKGLPIGMQPKYEICNPNYTVDGSHKDQVEKAAFSVRG